MRKTANNGPKGQKVHGERGPTYHLTVTIEVSDNRRRDLDGALATICDIIVAVGRQLQGDNEDKGGGGEGSKR